MKAFITVMGHDTVGVVAKVSGLCSELHSGGNGQYQGSNRHDICLYV